MKLHLPLALLSSLMACFAPIKVSAAVPTVTPGSIVFLGDSITQGAGGGIGSGYRYQVFKNFVDNGKEYIPVGSRKTNAAEGNTALFYGGKEFDKTNEGHSGWWASDLNGTTGSSLSATNNHASIENWTGQSTTQFGGNTYTGSTYNPETVFIFAGTNDILHTNNTTAPDTATMVERITKCAEQYRAANPNAKVYISALLPQEASGYNSWNPAHYNTRVSQINEELKRIAEEKGYIFVQTDQGMKGQGAQPVSSDKIFTGDNLHPNAQGELIMAGNIARAMGIGQRSAGLTRKGASTLGSSISMSMPPTVRGKAWSKIAEENAFLINSKEISVYEQSWSGVNLSNGFTCELSLQMFADMSPQNTFSLLMGNGTVNGLLNVMEDRTQWGDKILYLGSNTGAVNDFRVVYRNADVANSILGGYYVWRNGVLIGEALTATGGNYNGLQAGVLASGNASAGLTNLSWDTTGAYAPDYSSLTGTDKDAQGTEKLGGFDSLDDPSVSPSWGVVWPTEATTFDGAAGTAIGTIQGKIDALGESINAKITGIITGRGNSLSQSTASKSTFIELVGQWKADTNANNFLNVVVGKHGTGDFHFKVGEGGTITNADGNPMLGVLFGNNGIKPAPFNGNMYMEFSSTNLAIKGSQVLNLGYFGGIVGMWNSSISGSMTMVFTAGTFGATNNPVTNTTGFIIGGGMSNGGIAANIHRSTFLEFSGGTFHNGIVAGGFNGNVATTTLGDGTHILIKGGTFSGNIYGGSAHTGAVGTADIANGTNIIVDGSGEQVLSIGGSIYGGSKGTGIVYGNTNITLKNFTQEKLCSFGENTTFNGGSEATGKVEGDKIISFNNVSGTFSNQLNNFDSIIVEKDSNIKLTHVSSGAISKIKVEEGASMDASNNLVKESTISGGGTLLLSSPGTYHYNLSHTGGQGIVNAGAQNVISTINIGESGSADSISMKSLQIGSGSISFDLGQNSNSGFDSLSLASMTSTGEVSILINPYQKFIDSGIYELIVGDLSGVESFLLGTVATSANQQWSLNTGSYKTDGKLILTITGESSKKLSWNSPTGGIWQSGGEPKPWNDTSGTSSIFHNGDTVEFSTISGHTATSLMIEGEVAPLAITVSGTTNYTFEGTGSITGNATLVKDGENTLVISTANTFSDGTTINAGVLVINNNSALGTGTIAFNGGLLKYGEGITTDISKKLTSDGTADQKIQIDLNGNNITWAESKNYLALIDSSTEGGGLLNWATSDGGKNVSIGQNATLKLNTANNADTVGTSIKLSGSGALIIANTNNTKQGIGALAGFTGEIIREQTGATAAILFSKENTSNDRFDLTLNGSLFSQAVILGSNSFTSGSTLFIRNLNGTGGITSSYGTSLNRGLNIEMTKDNAYSGSFHTASAASNEQWGTVTIGSQVGGNTHTFTWTGLTINNNGNYASLGAKAKLVINNAIVDFGGGNKNGAWFDEITLNESGTLRISRSDSTGFVHNQGISGTGKIVIAGNATFSGSNAGYTGKINIESGSLKTTHLNGLGTQEVTLSGIDSELGSLDLGTLAITNGIVVANNKYGNIINASAFAGALTVNGTLNMGVRAVSDMRLHSLTVNENGSLIMDIIGSNSDKIIVTNSLTLSSNSSLSLTVKDPVSNQLYTLIDASALSSIGAASTWTPTFSINVQRGITASPAGWGGEGNKFYQISFSGTAGSASLTWAGTVESSIWENQGSSPWIGGGDDNKFWDKDSVTFDNTATVKSVEIKGNVTPSEITIKGNNYSFGGEGSLMGDGAMLVNIEGADTDKTVAINTSNSAYSGTITLTSGKLILGAVDAAGTGEISFNGGVLYIGANNALSGNVLSVSEGSTIQLGVENDQAYSCNINGSTLPSFEVTKLGGGSLTLVHTAVTNYAKHITLSAGTLELKKGANITIANTADINGGGNLVSSGTNSLIIAKGDALANFTGKIEVKESTLELGTNATGGVLNTGVAGANTITMQSGTVLKFNGGSGAPHTIGSNLNLYGNVEVSVHSADINQNNHYIFSGDIKIGNQASDLITLKTQWAKVISISGELSGEGSIKYTADNDPAWSVARKVVLSHANENFTGTFLLDSSSAVHGNNAYMGLFLTHADALKNGSVKLINTNNQLAVSAPNATIAGLEGAGYVGGAGGSAAAPISHSLSINQKEGEKTFSGIIADNAYTGANATAFESGNTLALIKNEEGSLILSGSNTYTGGTTLNNGTLTAETASAFGSGAINLNGGILNVNGMGIANDINITYGVLSGAALATGNITVKQNSNQGATHFSLHGISGSKLTSFAGATTSGVDQATKITNIGNGDITLNNTSTQLGISSDMVSWSDKSSDAPTGQVFSFNNEIETNAVNINGNLELALTDNTASDIIAHIEDDILLRLTNGKLTLSGNISFLSPYNIFDSIIVTGTGTVEGGSLKITSKNPELSGWLVLPKDSSEFVINNNNTSLLSNAVGIYNDQTLSLSASAGDVSLYNLEGANLEATVNTAVGAKTTVTFANSDKVAQKGQLYQGSVIGDAELIKAGDSNYNLTIGGNVETTQLTVSNGELTISGNLTTTTNIGGSGDVSVTSGAKLALKGASNTIIHDLMVAAGGKISIGTPIAAGRSASLVSQTNIGGNLVLEDTSIFELIENATVNVGSTFTDTAGASVSLADGSQLIINQSTTLNSTVTGKGSFVVKGQGSVFSVAEGSLGNNIILSLESEASATVTASGMSMGGLAGDGSVTINGSLSLHDASSAFTGTLRGNGSINHSGTGTQTFDTAGNKDITLTQSGNGTSILKHAENDIQYSAINAIGGSMHIVNSTSVANLTVGASAHLILGSDKRDDIYTLPASLTSQDTILEGGAQLTLGGINASTNKSSTLPGFFDAGNVIFSGTGAFTFNVGTMGEWTDSQYTITLMNGADIDTQNYNAILQGSLKNLGYTITEIISENGSLQIRVSNSGGNGFLAFANSYNTTAAAKGLWNARFDSLNKDGILNSIISAIRDTGSNVQGSLTEAQATEALATYAASSITSLLSTQRDDLRQQVKWIRNRTSQMGLNSDYVNEEIPYFNAWVQGNGAYSTVDQNGDEAGYTLNTWGGTVGFDVDISEHLTIGSAFTADYNKIKTQSLDRAEGDNDAYYANLFARVQHKKWAHTLIVTGGWNDANLKRTVRIADNEYKTSGNTTGSSYGAFYEGTYDIALNQAKTSLIQPLFNASIYSSSMDSYTETGMGDASIQASDMKATYGTMGLGARLLGMVGSNILGRSALGELRAQISQDYGDRANEATLCPIGAPSGGMRIRGTKVGTTGIQLGAGLVIPVGEGGSIYADVDTDFRSRATVVSGNIGYRYNF